jgi:hypothetical protein
MRNVYNISARRLEDMKTLGRPSGRWENIKMDLKDMCL